MLLTYHNQCASKIYLELMYSSKTLSYDCQFLDVNVDYIVSLICTCSCSFYNHLKILIPFSFYFSPCLSHNDKHALLLLRTYISSFVFGD